MTSFSDYGKYDAIGLAQLIRSGEVSRVEVLEAAISRLEELNPRLGMVVHKEYERAQRWSAGAEGLFAGVPFLTKDTNDLAGAPTGWGSKMYRDYIAEHSDTLTERYQKAGFVIFGKTNTPEFALVGTTEPVAYGPTRNPFDETRTAGGSSGGAAAAVATRVVAAAQASDGAGSIRCPASACGIFGLKPTRARNPVGPNAGEGWQSMLTQHVMTRTVRDSAAILDVTHGAELGGPYGLPAPERPFLEEVGRDPGHLRIALMTSSPGYQTDPVCKQAAIDAAKRCAGLGHHVEEASVPSSPDAMFAILGTVCSVWVRDMMETRARQLGRAAREDDVEAVSWEMYQRAASISANEYLSMIQEIHRTGRRVAEFFQNYDVLITPGLAQLPVLLGAINTTTSIEEMIPPLIRFCPFTTTFNVTGQPAASLPLSWTPEGLPIGVQFVTRFGDEATLFRISAQLESDGPWQPRR